VPIAYIAAGVPINNAMIENLRRLSVLPATIGLALQAPDGGLALAAETAGRAHGVPLPQVKDAPFGQPTLVGDMGTEFLRLITRLPTVRNSATIAAVFDYPLADALQPFYDIVLPVSIALFIGLAVAMLGAALIARGVSRPIELLAATARRIAGGDYSAPPAVAQSDEIGALSGAIDTMVQAIADRQRRLETAASALEFARDEAVRANAAKSQFLANMSHELRTPLNAVIGFGDMIHGQLLGPIGNERYIEYARDIRDSGAHLLSLVEEVLDLAKVEAGTLQLTRERVAPGEVLKGTLPALSALADKGAVRLQIADDHMSWPPIDADEMKIKQVFINLISNAIKFTPAGGRVSVAAAVVDGALKIDVADSGIGMRAEDVTLVVQPFYRAMSALNGKYQGAGLGLPLSKAIVDLHGGRMSIASVLGQGTTVSITLPLAEPRSARTAA
jgi:signal transduction histidine kinase